MPAITLGDAEQGAQKLLEDALRRYRRRDYGAIRKLVQDNPNFAQNPRVKPALHRIAKLLRPKMSPGRPRRHPISPYVVAGEVERLLEQGEAKSKRDAYKQIARQRSRRRTRMEVNPETLKGLRRAAYSDPRWRPQLVLGEEIMSASSEEGPPTHDREGLKEGYQLTSLKVDVETPTSGNISIYIPFWLCQVACRDDKTLVIRFLPEGRFKFQFEPNGQDTVEGVALLRERKGLRFDYRITVPGEDVELAWRTEILFEDTAR